MYLRFQKIAALAAVIVLLMALTQRAWGEPVTTIRNNGDSANRVDLVVLGDGYSMDEIDKYSSDVESFVQGLFAQEPISEYQRYFNVHRVDVISNQSGADHPEQSPPVFRDTALDATYNCAGIQRLICVNISKVNDVLSRSVPPDQREVILVIVNDIEYGGSGGAIAVASINPLVVELVLHELGHSFGLLADEYTDTPPPCNNSVEPPEPNVTKETFRSLIKWNVGGGPPEGWIELSTPVPTNSIAPGIPGLYQGAKYCIAGLYRPTFNSKMRSLDFPFEQINSEQLVKRIYNWASPIDSSEPFDSTVNLASGQTQIFAVQVPQPLNHSLDVTWKVNGNTAATTEQFTFSATGAGSHTVEVFVSDPTVLVRNDPASFLKETRRWDVIVEPAKMLVAIDIRPRSDANKINPSSTKNINVAIFSGNGFDATTVDPNTVRFGATGAEAAPIHVGLRDVNGDGRRDMVVRFEIQDTGIKCGDTFAFLTGQISNGPSIIGSSPIQTVQCSKPNKPKISAKLN
jgi:IgA Peptidase M64